MDEPLVPNYYQSSVQEINFSALKIVYFFEVLLPRSQQSAWELKYPLKVNRLLKLKKVLPALMMLHPSADFNSTVGAETKKPLPRFYSNGFNIAKSHIVKLWRICWVYSIQPEQNL